MIFYPFHIHFNINFCCLIIWCIHFTLLWFFCCIIHHWNNIKWETINSIYNTHYLYCPLFIIMSRLSFEGVNQSWCGPALHFCRNSYIAFSSCKMIIAILQIIHFSFEMFSSCMSCITTKPNQGSSYTVTSLLQWAGINLCCFKSL